MKLSTCIIEFFNHYLTGIKGVSTHTVKAYRDTFSILLPFAAEYHGIKIDSLRIDHLSSDLILSFLNFLESDRNNGIRTRNHRLAAIKSFAKMIRFLHPDKRNIAETIIHIPQKRSQRKLIGFLYPDEILKVFQSVGLKKAQGMRDYTLLHLLDDSGARASEVAALNLDYFDPQNQTLAILGKGNRFRQITLKPKTVHLITLYISKYRTAPKWPYRHRLFINQRQEEFTRHGIYRLCKKYLENALTEKRLQHINPAHSFRHSCAIRMLCCGESISDIKNRLGHDNIQSTTIYLQLDLTHRKQVQKKFIEYTQSLLIDDPKIGELIGWENKKQILQWLDTL
jgi:site-specific recombinase XerD